MGQTQKPPGSNLRWWKPRGHVSGNPDELVHVERFVRHAKKCNAPSPVVQIDVPRLFGRLKDWRRVHTRYDRCAHTFVPGICIAATVIF